MTTFLKLVLVTENWAHVHDNVNTMVPLLWQCVRYWWNEAFLLVQHTNW